MSFITRIKVVDLQLGTIEAIETKPLKDLLGKIKTTLGLADFADYARFSGFDIAFIEQCLAKGKAMAGGDDMFADSLRLTILAAAMGGKVRAILRSKGKAQFEVAFKVCRVADMADEREKMLTLGLIRRYFPGLVFQYQMRMRDDGIKFLPPLTLELDAALGDAYLTAAPSGMIFEETQIPALIVGAFVSSLILARSKANPNGYKTVDFEAVSDYVTQALESVDKVASPRVKAGRPPQEDNIETLKSLVVTWAKGKAYEDHDTLKKWAAGAKA